MTQKHLAGAPCLWVRKMLRAMLLQPAVVLPYAQDVFKPDPQRLRKHLSAIINFARFRDDKATGYQEHQVRVAYTHARACARTCLCRNAKSASIVLPVGGRSLL